MGAIVKKSMITLAGAVAGVALALAFAGPASAAGEGNPADSPQLQAWLNSPNVATVPPAPATASPLAVAPRSLAAAPTAGARFTHKRGGVLLWTSNSFEWYWNSSTITSSSGWQANGYIFPNTASNGGISRTLATASQHNWRGTATVGSGIVTPWGAVNVYKTSQTDYYQLKRGGAYVIN